MTASEKPITNILPALTQWVSAQRYVHSEKITIAEAFNVEIRFSSNYLSNVMRKALAHLRDGEQRSHVAPAMQSARQLQISVCHGELPAAAFAQTMQPVEFLADGKQCVCIQSDPHTISTLDASSGQAVFWIKNETDFPWYEQSCPLRNLFHWWFRDFGLQLLHGAAIANSSGGALLLGTSGAGKSTTTLSCLRAGMHLVADDLTLLDMRHRSPELISLYNSIKFNSAEEAKSLEPFAQLVETTPPQGEKYIGFMHQSRPSLQRIKVPLKAILVNKIGSSDQTTLFEITSGEATKMILAPITEVLLGPMPSDFFSVFRLLKSAPCYVLEAGRDLQTIPPAVANLLNSMN